MVPPDIPPASCNSKTSRDYVTAHKISLLVLIKEFCVVRHRSLHKRPNAKLDENSWEHTNQQNRDFASTMLKLIQVIITSVFSWIICIYIFETNYDFGDQ